MENLMDRIIDEDCEWLLEDRRPQEMDMNPRLKSFLEQREIEDKHDDNYGWLEPNGTFHPGRICGAPGMGAPVHHRGTPGLGRGFPILEQDRPI